MLEWLAPFHPRAVHFPIALLLVGVLAAGAGLLWRRKSWFGYGRLTLLLGWLGALIAMITGLIDQARAPQDAAIAAIMNRHITAGVALFVAAGLALYWPLRNKRLPDDKRARWGYLALLLVIGALILLEGALGGQLVYHFGVGVK